MIKSLSTEDTGLAPEMSVEWSKRINLITGDNGLGKSFLLDLSWWALTKTWASLPVSPQLGRPVAVVRFVLNGKTEEREYTGRIFVNGADGTIADSRPVTEGVVVYVRVDGGLSIWDPFRNGWAGPKDGPDAFHFEARQVWDGLDVKGIRVCEGLERDWVSWQKGREPQFEALVKVLELLSPPDETISPGKPQRVFLGEGRDRPTIMVSGYSVPLVHASAGIRRIISIAYVLVWSWFESTQAAKLVGYPPPDRLAVLFDEPETHLHPRWQRTILPSILAALQKLRGEELPEPQVMVATHSPLVLASVEPLFDSTKDDLIQLSLEDEELVVSQGHWSKQGDAANWLVSETFGLEQARNKPAEEAIEAAEALMRGDREALPPDLDTREKIQAALERLLPDHDPFWARWLVPAQVRSD